MATFDASESCEWLRVDVDAWGVVLVRDLVEGRVAEPIETVGVPSADWPGQIAEAVKWLLAEAGHTV